MICLTLVALASDQACVIEPGPPCVSVFDPRLRSPDCTIKKGACFTVGMEGSGETTIVSALYNIHPTCGNVENSLALLTEVADEYVASLQSMVPMTNVQVHDCVKQGYVDIVLHEMGGHHPPD